MTAQYALDVADVRAVIADLIASTLGVSSVEALARPALTPLGSDGFGADSFDLVELARRVSTFFPIAELGLEDNLLRAPSIATWTTLVLDAWTASPHDLTFVTSGSTGTPVAHRHSWGDLIAEIAVFANLFADRCRVVGLVPRHHIYGFLFTVVLPRVMGVDFVDVRERSPASVLRALQPGDLAIGFPLAWSAIATCDERIVRDVCGVTSTAPCPADLHIALRERGLGRLRHIYGSSETAGIGWQDDPSDGFRLLPYWSRAPDDRLLRCDGDAVREPVLPPDELVWRDERFFVGTRRDRAVQVGGVNVYPKRVAAIIETHPGVRECVVRPMRVEEGHRLKAFVVPTGDGDAISVRELQRWVDERVSSAERPRAYRVGETLPRDAHGKLTDWS
ncbi:MAG: hypothetical protein NVS2B8_20840 [Vulcanimicrobiaceae bacterium]